MQHLQTLTARALLTVRMCARARTSVSSPFSAFLSGAPAAQTHVSHGRTARGLRQRGARRACHGRSPPPRTNTGVSAHARACSAAQHACNAPRARQAEVADLQVAVGVQQQVGRLEVAVQHIGRVNVL
jgi:hypothetical protein